MLTDDLKNLLGQKKDRELRRHALGNVATFCMRMMNSEAANGIPESANQYQEIGNKIIAWAAEEDFTAEAKTMKNGELIISMIDERKRRK